MTTTTPPPLPPILSRSPLFWLLKAIALLPLPILYILSDILYILIRHIVRYRRRIVRRNLVTSFPDKTPAEIRCIERRFYRNFADYIIETLKLLHISDAEISRRITFSGLEIPDAILRQGRSVLIYFSHTGNWEWAPSVTLHDPLILARQAIGVQVYRPLSSPWFDALMLHIRSRFGSISYTKKTVFRDLLLLRRDSTLCLAGFMSDQKPSHADDTHIVQFLNHPTAIITGTETLARRLGMGVIYWDMTKPSRGHYHIQCRLITDDPASLPPGAITDAYAQMLQTTILRQPDIWLWTHNRWKNPVTLPTPTS